MRETIRLVLHKLKDDFKDDKTVIFTNPKRFRAALNDIKIETDAKKIRHLLNLMVQDMQAYSRLESDLSKNPFIIDNLASEMSSDYFVDKELARTVIECLAELLGYEPQIETRQSFDSLDALSKGTSQQEDLQKLFEKGIAYYFGDGVDKDLDKSEHCLLKAATDGHIEAQCALGDYFADEMNSNADPSHAMEWYFKAAKNGHPKAQWLLGAGFFSGDGVEKDADKARHWFQKSADQGNADGEYGLAGCLFVMQDYEAAEYWLRKAAVQGHVEARKLLEAAAPLFRSH